MRVGENSPNLWPTIFSVIKTGINCLPLWTAIVCPTKSGEIIEAVEFEIPQKSCYKKHPNPASRYAVAGVYVAKYKNGVNVAVTGAKSCVYRDENLSKALDKDFSASAVEAVSIPSKGMNSDIHASADYRAGLVSTLAKRAVESC